MIRAKARQFRQGSRGTPSEAAGPPWLNHNWLDDLERIASESDTEVRIMFGRNDVDHRDYETIQDGRISGIFDVLGDRLEIERVDGSVHQLHTPAAQQATLVAVRAWLNDAATTSDRTSAR
jgi:hypothetical protein